MGNHLHQNINLPLSQRVQMLNTSGLIASPFTGTVSTSVLRFLGAGVVTGPPAYIAEFDSVTLGLRVAIRKAGVYEVKLYLQQAISTSVVFGISQDVAVAALTGVPAFANAGTLDVQANVSAAVAATALSLTTQIIVGPEQESAIEPVSGLTGSIISFLATTAGGAAPTALLTPLPCYYRIRRINDANE